MGWPRLRTPCHVLTFAISKECLHSLAKSSPRAREGMFGYMKERYGE